MRAGVDVGGTFTDAVVWDGEHLLVTKVPTTGDQSIGVLGALEELGATGVDLSHGTTVATNALLERSGARTALVTDAGFEDVIEIGRQDRPSLYDMEQVRPDPLVPRPWRVGLAGRATVDDAGGLTADALGEIVERLREIDPEVVAVSLLYGFEYPSREGAVAQAVRVALGEVAISLSSRVAPEFREVERASTTIIDAYLRPAVSSYLRQLHETASSDGRVSRIAVMRSSGGLLDLQDAADQPAALILSGPAGGVVAAAALGDALGRASVISFDMGGTSTDVCRIEGGRPRIDYERPIDGLPCRMPAVAVHTVGAGGGSIAWLDSGGALRVGPRSAGARPGPASYALGGAEATVTDANVALGRIDAAARFGGSITLDGDLASAALGRLAEATGLSLLDTAAGVVNVVESHMERAIRRVSVEDGSDPRGSTLVAFGGAGGLHATALARRLDMAAVVVPAHSGLFSAVGLLLAPPRADVARSVTVEPGGLDGVAVDMASQARRALPGAALEVRAIVDARYVGQSSETQVEYTVGEGWEPLAERFHAAHEARNGFSRPDDPIEVVTVRAEAVGAPALVWDDLPRPVAEGESRRGSRLVVVGGGEVEAAVWWRPGLAHGDEIVGPAVVEEPGATTLVGVGERAVVGERGELEVTW